MQAELNKDYLSGISKLDGLSSMYIKESKYVLLLKRDEKCIIVRVYNGNFVWMQQIDQKQLDYMRKKSEVQGTYASFCELLRNSIEGNNYIISQEGMTLNVIFQFKLARDVFLKGSLEMGDGIPMLNNEDTRKIQSDFTFDLFTTLKNQNQRNDKVSPEVQLQQANVNNDHFIVNQFQDEKKKRANANIVQPHLRKRKELGAKLA